MRAAIADRRQREHRAGEQADQRRLQAALHLGAGLERHQHDASGGDDDGGEDRQRQPVAEENESEYRSLNRFGLDVGDGDDERAVVHRHQHRGGGDDLRTGAEDDPGNEAPSRPGQRQAGHDQHAGEKDERERKAEQEAHVGGADGAERRGQLALHGVARGLPGGGEQGEHDPEPACSNHRGSLNVMPGLVPGIHVFLVAKQGVDGRDKPGHDSPPIPAPPSACSSRRCRWRSATRRGTDCRSRPAHR